MRFFLAVFISLILVASTAFAYFGAKYEPPDGKTYHGVGWHGASQNAYLEMLPDSMQPLLHQAMVPLPGYMRRGGMTVQGLLTALAPDNFDPETQYAEISVQFELNTTRGDSTIAMMVDTIFADSDTYDSYMDTLAIALRQDGRPLFLRIGLEMNGSWNGYTPWAFPRAFRKLALGLRERGVDNFVTVWCYEPDAPNDFADSTGWGWKWYPGDDVVDWFGLDPFDADHFDPDAPDSVEGRGGMDISKKGRTEQFLRFAEERRKPVYLNELSARHVWITPHNEDVDSTHGEVDWDYWFEPFFRFMDNHPNIKAFNYINLDWTTIGQYQHWGDARLEINEYIRDHWVEAMSDERYIHAGYDISQHASVGENVIALPDDFNLNIYPNPFNSSFNVNYNLTQRATVKLKLYSLTGAEVWSAPEFLQNAGQHLINVDCKELTSGVYFIVLSSNGITRTNKVLLMR
jgi:hypothetical protein